MSWDQILDLPYDLAFPILLPVVAYYRDDATVTRCRSLSNSSRFSSSSFVLTLWSTNCSSCAILPVYIARTIPKIYLPNRLNRRSHSPYLCDPRFFFQQAARPMFVLSNLLKIVAGTAFFLELKPNRKFTRYLLFVETGFSQQDSSPEKNPSRSIVFLLLRTELLTDRQSAPITLTALPEQTRDATNRLRFVHFQLNRRTRVR
ncbi:hypothetical protein ALC56_11607 [Trachymyrmex septentrionalis]|uniref:Uncharacterized protein n=1 Tax=Trachymyrmex septentrionalis TaxID=34720 RepID=A0A195F1Q9_9HYME|nr:hypothetical protein ALC56_11607 [Trachymyrmex septentrionalis]